jgi:exonuclease III
MKLIAINTWGGRKMEALETFFKKHHDVDIFCFQEVYHDAHGKDTIWVDGSNFNFLGDVKKMLTNYDCYYRPHLDDWWGLAIFIKKRLPVLAEGEHFVHKHKGHNPAIEILGHTAKNIQFLTTEIKGKPITILNIHGLWNGQGKRDTEERLMQSRNAVKFIETLGSEYVFCGDFNLDPDTESLQMIPRELGSRDLIKEYGVTSTRTSLYPKPNKFADYVFISKGIDLIDFKVLPDEVSDHTPLFLEFR